jgi:hypothetical protein
VAILLQKRVLSGELQSLAIRGRRQSLCRVGLIHRRAQTLRQFERVIIGLEVLEE